MPSSWTSSACCSWHSLFSWSRCQRRSKSTANPICAPCVPCQRWCPGWFCWRDVRRRGWAHHPSLPRPSSSSEPPPSCRDHSSHRHAQFIGVIHWSCHRRKRAVVARPYSPSVPRSARRSAPARGRLRPRTVLVLVACGLVTTGVPPSFADRLAIAELSPRRPAEEGCCSRSRRGRVPERLDAVERGIDLNRPLFFA